MSKQGPKIRHIDSRGDFRSINLLLNNFIKKINEVAADSLQKGELNKSVLLVSDDSLENTLLIFRKKLASTIKSGMLERKDKEPEVAFYSAIVWFLRQEKETRERIMDEC